MHRHMNRQIYDKMEPEIPKLLCCTTVSYKNLQKQVIKHVMLELLTSTQN